MPNVAISFSTWPKASVAHATLEKCRLPLGSTPLTRRKLNSLCEETPLKCCISARTRLSLQTKNPFYRIMSVWVLKCLNTQRHHRLVTSSADSNNIVWLKYIWIRLFNYGIFFFKAFEFVPFYCIHVIIFDLRQHECAYFKWSITHVNVRKCFFFLF